MKNKDIQQGIILVDSVNYLDSGSQVKIAIAGSHGGIYAAYKAAKTGVRAVILNDAGVGLQNAGIACLEYCEKIGMAAAVVSHTSARIGQSADMFERGRLSGVNTIAHEIGCEINMTCKEAAEILRNAPHHHSSPPNYEETRFVISEEYPRVICIDSASLVKPEDAGQIVVTGSHGGLIGGKKEKAFNVDAAVTIFNDAGVGIDRAGVGRLAPLEERGIAAVTVAHSSAAIGNSRSTYEDGVISYANSIALELGAEEGGPVKAFIKSARRKISSNQYNGRL